MKVKTTSLRPIKVTDEVSDYLNLIIDKAHELSANGQFYSINRPRDSELAALTEDPVDTVIMVPEERFWKIYNNALAFERCLIEPEYLVELRNKLMDDGILPRSDVRH